MYSANFALSNLVEQRVCLKFCVSNKISCAEALKMLTAADGDSTMSKTQAYEWYKEFKAGRTVVDDLPRFGRPSTSVTDENIEEVKKIVLEDRRVSIREIAADLGVSFRSVQSVMHDVLGLRRVEARLVLRVLNVLQKQYRIAVAEEMLSFIQAPYSPDMALCDFFLFPRLKLPLRGKRFETIEATKVNSQKELKAISKSAYEKCFEDSKKRWNMCITCDGDYFEGNKINIDD